MSGVDFYPVVKDTAKSMLTVVEFILGLNIPWLDKRKRIAAAFSLIGSDFYTKMFEDNSEIFDSSAIKTTDYGEMVDQVERLSTKIVRNHALGRKIDHLVESFYNSALGKAQDEAFRNAVSLNKKPTLTRTMVGETCKWCKSMEGVHINPTSDMFRRHANCDCLFVVSGYKTRNGILKNYTKRNKNTNTGSIPNGVSNFDSRLMDEYDKIPIEYKSSSYLFKKIKPNSGRNEYDTILTNAELDLFDKLTALNIPFEVISIPSDKSISNDTRMLGNEWELKTKCATGDATIMSSLRKATDKGKSYIILDVSYMDKPMSWIFDKIEVHLEKNKNAHLIRGIIVVRDMKLIRYL